MYTDYGSATAKSCFTFVNPDLISSEPHLSRLRRLKDGRRRPRLVLDRVVVVHPAGRVLLVMRPGVRGARVAPGRPVRAGRSVAVAVFRCPTEERLHIAQSGLLRWGLIDRNGPFYIILILQTVQLICLNCMEREHEVSLFSCI